MKFHEIVNSIFGQARSIFVKNAKLTQETAIWQHCDPLNIHLTTCTSQGSTVPVQWGAGVDRRGGLRQPNHVPYPPPPPRFSLPGTHCILENKFWPLNFANFFISQKSHGNLLNIGMV